MNKENMGWAVAGAMATTMVMGVLLLSSVGFQQPALKIGTVSLPKVFNDSEFAKRQDSELKSLGAARQATIQFIDAYKMLPRADLVKFRDLTVKANQTDADRAEIERIRQAAIQADQRFRELQTKANATEAERTQLGEFQRRVQENQQFLIATNEEFTQELANRQDKLRSDTLDRVKASVNDVAKNQGYSVILSDEIAPYSANDITSEALKNMNNRK